MYIILSVFKSKEDMEKVNGHPLEVQRQTLLTTLREKFPHAEISITASGAISVDVSGTSHKMSEVTKLMENTIFSKISGMSEEAKFFSPVRN